MALTAIAALEPCTDFTELQLSTKRDPEFDVDSNPICDRWLTPGWYRVKDSIMTTSPPDLGKCGTSFPIWLVGQTPTIVNTSVNLTACQVGFFSTCETTYDIEVRKCPNNDLVYHLQDATICNSAYCFENLNACVNTTVSDVKAGFSKITWIHQNNSRVGDYYQPVWNFVCIFVPINQNSLFYTVEWYADNEWIANYTVHGTAINETMLTSEYLLNSTKKMGVQLQCAVGAKKTRESMSCFHETSEQFLAGFEILNTTLTIDRNGKETLFIKQTIPYADTSFPHWNQTGPLFLVPSYSGSLKRICKDIGNPKKCQISVTGVGYNFQSTFEGVTHQLEIQSLDPLDYYLQQQRLVLRLGTETTQPFFSGVTFPDIHINVVENSASWKGKRCSSYADPHMTTFDGIPYECHKNGCSSGTTYVLYENKNHSQQVQVRHGSCWGRPQCVCAVAARSGRDVFIVDFCSGREFINFPICEDQAMQVFKDGDFTYRVIFPTGTSLKIYIYESWDWDYTTFISFKLWYINVEVYPTIADEEATTGLCGFLDDIPENDLRWKNGFQDDPSLYDYYINHPDNFSRSWGLPSGSNEDLLLHDNSVYNSLSGLNVITYKLCYCDGTKGPVCSYKQYQDCKTQSRGEKMTCSLHTSNRKKRDIRILQDRKIREYNVVLKRAKRQALLSQAEATNLCTEAFQESAHYETCLQNVPNFGNETLINCINDLTMTGNENLTQLHVETALDQCKEYIYYNSTLQTEETDIVSKIVLLCAKNCSNRGSCNEGNCTCDPGYGGSDCSFDMLAPPTITHISDGGLCDKTTENCDDIAIYGRYFVKSSQSYCFMRSSEFNSSGSAATETFYQVSLKEITLFEAHCNLQYQTNESWITKFDFNVTNDGRQFTDTFTVHVYQSECQVFNNQSGIISFSLQENYCFIKGSCIKENTMESNTSCLQCDPKLDAFEWVNACTTSTEQTTHRTGEASSTNDPSMISSKASGNYSTNAYTTTTPLSTVAIALTKSSKVPDTSKTTTSSTTSSFFTTSNNKSSSTETKSPQNPSSPSVTVISKEQTHSETHFPTTKTAVQSSQSHYTAIATETQQTDSVIKTTSPQLLTTLASNHLKHEQNNESSKKLTNSELVGIGIACFVALIIVSIAGVLLKKKFTNRDTSASPAFNTEDINIYPDRKTVKKDTFDPKTSLFSFPASADMYSRPPSATSLRKGPATVDLSHIYQSQHLDSLFTVKGE